MDYAQLSDQKINGLVMDALSDGNQNYQEGNGSELELLRQVNDVQFGEHVEYDEVYAKFDPCKNPADAWPIIFENLISVEPDYEFIDPSEDEAFASGLWIAEHFDGKTETVRHADPSPLRAAMVVFLMMQDKADANS